MEVRELLRVVTLRSNQVMSLLIHFLAFVHLADYLNLPIISDRSSLIDCDTLEILRKTLWQTEWEQRQYSTVGSAQDVFQTGECDNPEVRVCNFRFFSSLLVIPDMDIQSRLPASFFVSTIVNKVLGSLLNLITVRPLLTYPTISMKITAV